MKRSFLITLISGKTHELPFEKVFTGFVPITPPNNIQLLKACCSLAMEGFMEPGSDARPKWIPSSQIRYVEIVFEETQLKVNGK